jgi:transposase-like protein
MIVQRKQYTAEFKQEAVRLMTEGGRSPEDAGQREAAIDHGTGGAGAGTHKLRRTSYEAFPGQERARDEELARLRRENATLKMEGDVPKKAIAPPNGHPVAEPRPR